MNHLKARHRSKQPTTFGWIPLHKACLHNDVKEVHKLWRLYPRGTRVLAPVDGLPIHVACGSRWYKEFHDTESTEIVRKLIQCDKATLCTKNPKGKIPLHLALGHNGTPLNILRILSASCNESLLIPTKEAFHRLFVFDALPIHLAIHHEKKTAIQIIMNAQPDAILIPCPGEDETGLLGLFVSLSTIQEQDGTPVLDFDKVQMVLTLFHDAKVGSSKTWRRDFLLHFILSWPLFSHQYRRLTFLNRKGRWYNQWQSDFVSVLQRLLSVGEKNAMYPEIQREESLLCHAAQSTSPPSLSDSLAIKDSNSNLPLHVALISGHGIQVIRFLLEQHPNAAAERGGSKGEFPLLIALKQQNPDPALVNILWKRHKVAALQMDSLTKLYPFQLGILNMQHAVGCGEAWLDLSYQMLREFPQFVLCNIQTCEFDRRK